MHCVWENISYLAETPVSLMQKSAMLYAMLAFLSCRYFKEIGSRQTLSVS